MSHKSSIPHFPGLLGIIKSVGRNEEEFSSWHACLPAWFQTGTTHWLTCGETDRDGYNQSAVFTEELVHSELSTLTPSFCPGLSGSPLVHLLLPLPPLFVFGSSLRSSLWAWAPFTPVMLLGVDPIQQGDKLRWNSECLWMAQPVCPNILHNITQKMAPLVSRHPGVNRHLRAEVVILGSPLARSMRGAMSQPQRLPSAPRLSPAYRPGVLLFIPPRHTLLLY